MPEPISSSSTNSSQASSSDYDPSLEESGQICRADTPPSPPPPPPYDVKTPSVTKLMSALPAPPSVLPPTSTANNNAQRTSERSGVSPYASMGVTGDGWAMYGGVAALKGHDAQSGLDVEVLSASAQGLISQEEYQLGLVRVAGSNGTGSFSAEAMTLRLNRGFHNDDGSTGLNLGTAATGVGIEGTLGSGADSLTAGLSASGGGSASVGVRDLDEDGNHELCAKLSIGPVTVGACVETPL